MDVFFVHISNAIFFIYISLFAKSPQTNQLFFIFIFILHFDYGSSSVHRVLVVE